MVDRPETPAGAGEERPPRGPQESSPRGSPGEPKTPPRAPPPPTAAPHVPPRLPAAPPRPACASRRRRPSCSRSAPRTAFPPLPSANDCFRVQKPPVRAAASRRQFRAQTPPPKAECGRSGPAPRQGGPRPRAQADHNLTPATPPGPCPLPST